MSGLDNSLVCKVCADKASGRHYGVLSCDGCRGFFKRSVRNKHLKQYSCRGEKKCLITSATRNQCQYCRYQKCLAVNMNKDAVQHPRGQRTQKRSVPRMSSPPSLQIHNSHGEGSRSAAFPPTHFLPQAFCPLPVSIPSFIQTLQLPVHPPALSWPLVTQQLFKPAAVRPVSHKSLSQAALSAPSPVSEADQLENVVRTCALYRFSGEMLAGKPTNDYSTWMKEMFLKIVDGIGVWVKEIAALTLLPLADRVLLLEKCWCSLFILIAAELKLPFNIRLLMKNCTAISERDQLTMREVLYRVQHLVGSLTAMGLDRNSYVCLKAMVIFNPEVKALTQRTLVSSFRQQVLSCLHTPELSPLYKSSAEPRVDWTALVRQIEAVDADVVEQILFPHLARGSVSKMVASAYKTDG